MSLCSQRTTRIASAWESGSVPPRGRESWSVRQTAEGGPSILLMDEPFGALDAETKWQMQELMIGIVEKSKGTVLLVTHDIEEAIFLADHIVFMSRHPGTVREVLVTEFKGGRRFASHEEKMEAKGFYDLEKEIMHLMREEMRDDPESLALPH